MSAVKEPHYFAGIDFPFPENEILHVTKNKNEYERLFSDAGSRIAGESSSYYLADPEAPGKIYTHNPKMKIIAILRDPVERAYSHYLLYNRRGKQPETFYEKVRELQQGSSPLVYDIVELGKYGKQLERYKKYFPADQMLVLTFDEFTKQPVPTLNKILAFLAVDVEPSQRLAAHKAENTYQIPRGNLAEKVLANQQVMRLGLKVVPRPLIRYVRNELLLKKSTKEPIDPRAAVILREIYNPEMKKVKRLLRSS